MTATELDLDSLLDALLARALERTPPPLTNQAGEEVGALATNGRLVVAAGDTIVASWGNITFDQTVVCFNSSADRAGQWSAPHNGALSYVDDVGVISARINGAWVPLQPDSRPPPVTSGTTVQTYVDWSGEMWVAKAGIDSGRWHKARDVLHFRLHRNAAWVANTAGAGMFFDAVDRDTYAMYNASNGRLYVAATGLYDVMWQMTVTPLAAGNYLAVSVPTLNSNFQTSFLSGSNHSGRDTWPCATAAKGSMYMVAGDAFAFNYAANGAGNFNGAPGYDATYVTVSYLGTGGG